MVPDITHAEYIRKNRKSDYYMQSNRFWLNLDVGDKKVCMNTTYVYRTKIGIYTEDIIRMRLPVCLERIGLPRLVNSYGVLDGAVFLPELLFCTNTYTDAYSIKMIEINIDEIRLEDDIGNSWKGRMMNRMFADLFEEDVRKHRIEEKKKTGFTGDPTQLLIQESTWKVDY